MPCRSLRKSDRK